MLAQRDFVTRLDAIVRTKSSKGTALDLRNRTLRWLVDAAEYAAPKGQELDDAGLAALERLPVLSWVPGCLLRLLAKPDLDWFRENPWRPRLIQYLTKTIDSAFYSGSVTEASQTHEKISSLILAVGTIESKFTRTIAELTALGRLSASRQSLFAQLNGRQGRILLRPFLPDDTDIRLKELFATAEAYVEGGATERAADLFTTASKEAEHVRDVFAASESTYGTSLAEMAERLRVLLQADFSNNAAAMPSRIVVERDGKKYPLHLAEHPLRISFVIRNVGPGYANDVAVTVDGAAPLQLGIDPMYIGRIAPDAQYRVDTRGVLAAAVESAAMDAMVQWRNFDGAPQEEMFSLTLPAQRPDVPWEKLAEREPYSLEPVETEEDLVGRRELFQRLLATVTAKNAGSVILHGQKRVGKTSVAKALKSRLQREGHCVVYVEAGDYIAPIAEDTLAGLGVALCTRLVGADTRFAAIPTPSFSDALSPLSAFLDAICAMVPPTKRIVLILDEFDQLPLALYDRTPIGDAFFTTLRSLSSRPQVAFVLVGGERITHIIDRQGQQLNKWKTQALDYFARDSDWSDYRELIQKPTENTLDFTDEAIVRLHDTSAGNPFFTNMLCQQLFETALQTRDSHVTLREVEAATLKVTMAADRNTFQHFWDDGILATGEPATERSARRKKVLLAAADVLERQSPATVSAILKEPLLRDVVGAEAEIREFVSRQILVGKDSVQFKVPLFFQWLRDRGVHDVIASFGTLDHQTRVRHDEARHEVSSQEMVELISRWPNYRGQHLTEDRVRHWLTQFSSAKERRAAFAILNGLRFYSNTLVREKLRELDAVIMRNVVRFQTERRKRSDILVSYLDGPAKSGAQLASLYAEEANIYVENVVDTGRVAEKLIARDEIHTVVFVDDFIGTGETLTGYIKSLSAPLVELICAKKVAVALVVVAAFVEGKRRVEAESRAWPFKTSLHTGEVLDASFKIFDDTSRIFPDPSDRAFARDMAQAYGLPLEKKCPLGFGDLELAVVFERGCPNNSLPILWSRSSRWAPLFPRE